MSWTWSAVLAAVGIAGLLLAGRGRWEGWAVGLGAQVLWVVYALVTQQWGFIASAVAYGVVYGTNAWRWRTAKKIARPRLIVVQEPVEVQWRDHRQETGHDRAYWDPEAATYACLAERCGFNTVTP